MGDKLNLAEWKNTFGLDLDASEQEVIAAAEKERASNPTLYAQFSEAMGTAGEAIADTASGAVKATESLGKSMNKAAGAATKEYIAGKQDDLKAGGFASGGAQHSMISGGDTHTKSPSDWARQFPQTPEDLDMPAAPEADKTEDEIRKNFSFNGSPAPTLGDTSKIDAQILGIRDNMQAFLTSGQAAEAGYEDEFAAELRKLRSDYKEAKSDIDKRELLHTLVDALTQFGAGYATAKTGSDLTNIKTKQHDFNKDREFALADHRTERGDLESRRKEDQQKRRDVADTTTKLMNLDLDTKRAEGDRVRQDNREKIDVWKETNNVAYQRAYLQVMDSRDEAATAKALNTEKAAYMRANAAEAKEFDKKWRGAGNEIAQIVQGIGNYKGIDGDDAKRAAIANVLTTSVDMSPEEAQTLSQATKGMIFKDIDDASIRSTMDKFAATHLEFKRNQAEGKVLLNHPQKGPGWVPYEQMPAAVKAGYKVGA